MPMTVAEAVEFTGKTRCTIHQYVKAGLIGVTKVKGRGPGGRPLFNVADLALVFGKTVPPEFADEAPDKAIGFSPQPRRRKRAKKIVSKTGDVPEPTHTSARCEEIFRAGSELLKALAGACLSSGLSRDQVEARLCVLMLSLCEDLEATAHRAFDTHRLLSIADAGTKRKGRPRRDLSSTKHNPFMLSLASQVSPAE